MYIFKFNKIIIELINDYLSCSDSKKYGNEGIKENLFKLYESMKFTIHINRNILKGHFFTSLICTKSLST